MLCQCSLFIVHCSTIICPVSPIFPRSHVQNSKYRIRLLIVLALCFSLTRVWSAAELPAQLTDEVFWQLVTEFSEPSGRFPSDNFVSNELATQRVLSELTKSRKASGAYVGVGPEQNFTYIVALQPRRLSAAFRRPAAPADIRRADDRYGRKRTATELNRDGRKFPHLATIRKGQFDCAAGGKFRRLDSASIGGLLSEGA